MSVSVGPRSFSHPAAIPSSRQRHETHAGHQLAAAQAVHHHGVAALFFEDALVGEMHAGRLKNFRLGGFQYLMRPPFIRAGQFFDLVVDLRLVDFVFEAFQRDPAHRRSPKRNGRLSAVFGSRHADDAGVSP